MLLVPLSFMEVTDLERCMFCEFTVVSLVLLVTLLGFVGDCKGLPLIVKGTNFPLIRGGCPFSPLWEPVELPPQEPTLPILSSLERFFVCLSTL